MTNTKNSPDKPMTERQEQVYNAINEYWYQHYMPPSIRDLCEMLNISSPNGIVCHLKALRQRGLLVGDPEKRSRAIVTVAIKEVLDAAA